MVPEDRKKDGIVPLMAVGKNITLAALDQFSHRLSTLDEAQEQQAHHQPGHRQDGDDRVEGLLTHQFDTEHGGRGQVEAGVPTGVVEAGHREEQGELERHRCDGEVEPVES